MRFVAYRNSQGRGLAVKNPAGNYHGCLTTDTRYPGDLEALLSGGDRALAAATKTLLACAPTDLANSEYLPPLRSAPKVICVGLNYADHSAESGFKVPTYPTIFARFASSFIGHGAPILRPRVSEQLDYEGELVAVIGKPGRHIGKEQALDHVAGYSIFNDASIRDYQLRTPQWTIGKNFDTTGAFGPEFVTSDELPAGARGLRLQTRLNGKVMQEASTDDMVFDVASLVSLLSEAMTLETGDIIVTGTPAGVGVSRKPQIWMKPGDVCEVDIEGIGTLRNPIGQEK